MSAALLVCVKGENQRSVQNLFASKVCGEHSWPSSIVPVCSSRPRPATGVCAWECVSVAHVTIHKSVCVFGGGAVGVRIGPFVKKKIKIKNKVLNSPHNVRHPQIRDLLLCSSSGRLPSAYTCIHDENTQFRLKPYQLGAPVNSRKNPLVQTWLSPFVRAGSHVTKQTLHNVSFLWIYQWRLDVNNGGSVEKVGRNTAKRLVTDFLWIFLCPCASELCPEGLYWQVVQSSIHTCEHDISRSLWRDLFKFEAKVHFDPRMNWFGVLVGQRSRVKLAATSWHPILRNTSKEFWHKCPLAPHTVLAITQQFIW